MGAIDGALEYFNQALQLAQQNGDVERVAVCYQGLGDTYFSSGRLRPAIESFQQALRIGEERGSDAGIATACTFLSNAHMRAGDLDEARDYWMRALEIGERLQDERRIAWACVILAQQFTERGELGNATEFLRRARTLMRRIGDYRGMAWTTGVEQGAPFCRWIVDSALRPEDVVEPLTEFAELSAASGGFQHEFAAFTAQLARAYLLMGRIEKAEAICLRVLEVANSMSNKLESGYAHMLLAEINATGERKDSEKTAHHLQKSITELSEAGAKTEVGRAHLVAARIALADMDFRIAKNDANSARLIFAKHGAISWEMEATAMLTKLESEASV
jgi:tetratricopeptide (TPR) repeat protein